MWSAPSVPANRRVLEPVSSRNDGGDGNEGGRYDSNSCGAFAVISFPFSVLVMFVVLLAAGVPALVRSIADVAVLGTVVGVVIVVGGVVSVLVVVVGAWKGCKGY